ncbi:hypothetical protein BIW11_02079 [Tropilaelaps mercedesae]|uniref:Uncharacterized protein n=1 Tax=Tropilaelaps mercedesae TaxID=418985 RepID=A0A1V9X3U7_9ACAR|nr:hypothetical protein BIW11_02079 [Tropilaelaps mercedesae]
MESQPEVDETRRKQKATKATAVTMRTHLLAAHRRTAKSPHRRNGRKLMGQRRSRPSTVTRGANIIPPLR